MRPSSARSIRSSREHGSWVALFAMLMIFIGPLISQSMPMDQHASTSMPMSMDMSMDMPGMDHSMEAMSEDTNMGEENGPQIKFATTFPSQGIYKVFTQFQYEGKVITSDYSVEVN